MFQSRMRCSIPDIVVGCPEPFGALEWTLAEGFQTRQLDWLLSIRTGIGVPPLHGVGIVQPWSSGSPEKGIHGLNFSVLLWPLRLISEFRGPVALPLSLLLKDCEGLVPMQGSYLVDPASSHMLVSKIKPCMSKYKQSIQ